MKSSNNKQDVQRTIKKIHRQKTEQIIYTSDVPKGSLQYTNADGRAKSATTTDKATLWEKKKEKPAIEGTTTRKDNHHLEGRGQLLRMDDIEEIAKKAKATL